MGFVLFTAVLMYYLRPRDEENAQFKSLRATLFLATMMLTGQGGPDEELPWYTSCVVVLTGVVSIGMFAIPASMLTWGFEGEAERLAKLRKHRASISVTQEMPSQETPSREADVNDQWSYSSDDYSSDEDYLNTIAGYEDDSDEEEKEARRTFNLVDTDRSGQVSMDEFLEYSRMMSQNRKSLRQTFGSPTSAQSSVRLEVLEQKVDEMSKKLDRICEILEEKRNSERALAAGI